MINIKHEIASKNKDDSFSIHRNIEIFSKLNKIKALRNRDRIAIEHMKDDIKGMRDELKYNLYSINLLTFKSKNFIFEYLLDADSLDRFRPRKVDEKPIDYLKARYKELIQAKSEHLKQIKEYRAKTKRLDEQKKQTLGFNYSMTGGVFNKPGQVIALQSVENQLSRIGKAKAPNKESKNKYVGIELELVAKVNRNKLNELLCKAFLAGYVYVKHDGSITIENDGEYPHEITVLCKEQDVPSVVNRLCAVLNSKEVGAYVNNSCGLHVHIDCRNRKPNDVYNNVTRCLPLLKKMVPQNRINSQHATRYCKMNQTSSWDDAQNNDRYMAVNVQSYRNLKTIEIRMHSGTTNAAKIINWCSILCGAANHPTLLDKDISTAYEYTDVIGCNGKLTGYMLKRIDLFTGKLSTAIDTRTDHFFYDNVETAV